VFRTEQATQRVMRKVLLYTESAQSAALIRRAEELFADGSVRLVKDESKTKAGFVLDDTGCARFVKRFEVQSLGRGLLERLRGSRAARSLKGAELLRGAGFARPTPLAAMELRRGGAVERSYLLSEALGQARTFSAFIDRRTGPAGFSYHSRAQVLRAVAREVRRLHDAGLFTSDLQETNLMLEQRPERLQVYFVDLDGFRRLRSLAWRLRRRNLVQLDRSVGRFLSYAERLRFLRDYLGGREHAPDGARQRQIFAARNERLRMHKLAVELLRERARKDRASQRKARYRALFRTLFCARALGPRLGGLRARCDR
jgi:tRNA A-37 threonylcarbamoyl transferase component Bud32